MGATDEFEIITFNKNADLTQFKEKLDHWDCSTLPNGFLFENDWVKCTHFNLFENQRKLVFGVMEKIERMDNKISITHFQSKNMKTGKIFKWKIDSMKNANKKQCAFCKFHSKNSLRT